MPRRQNNNKSTIASLRREVGQLKRLQVAQKIRLQPDPPSIVFRPWFTATIELLLPVVSSGATTATAITLTQIRAKLNTQLGIPVPVSPAGIEFRLLNASAWGNAGSELRITFLHPVGEKVLGTYSDASNLTGRPRFGIRYPTSISSLPVDEVTTGDLALVIFNDVVTPTVTTNTAIIRWHVLFRMHVGAT